MAGVLGITGEAKKDASMRRKDPHPRRSGLARLRWCPLSSLNMEHIAVVVVLNLHGAQ